MTVPEEKILSYKVIDSSSVVQVIEIKTNEGTIIYNVIAAIATNLLPEAVKGICSVTVGDPDACKIAYEATSMLVLMRGTKIYTGIVNSIKYIANRGIERSSATVETFTYKFASNVKSAFEIYKKYGCINWDNVYQVDSGNQYKSYCYYIVFGSADNKVYFHNSPDPSTIRNAYFSSKEYVFVQEVKDGFGYVEFVNKREQYSAGWIKMSELTPR